MVTDKTPRRKARQQHGPGRQPVINRLVLAGLRSPLHRLFDGGTVGLRYLSIDGRAVTLPVAYVRNGQDLVVLVGGSRDKKWWRHFRSREPVDVWWQGAWRPTAAQVFAVGSPEYLGGAIAYRTKHPQVKTSQDPIVLIAIPAVPDTAPQPPARM